MAETEQERARRRANEAWNAVAKVWPELLDTSGVDVTLLDLNLSLTAMERLENGHDFELGKEWLRSLRRVEPSEGR